MKMLVVGSLAIVALASACTHHHFAATLPGHARQRVEVSHFKGSLEGLGIGALAGIVVGAGTGLAEGGDGPCNEDSWFCLSASDKAVFYGAVFGMTAGAGGAVVGAIIGSHEVYHASEDEAPTPRLSTRLLPGGAAATVAWTF